MEADDFLIHDIYNIGEGEAVHIEVLAVIHDEDNSPEARLFHESSYAWFRFQDETPEGAVLRDPLNEGDGYTLEVINDDNIIQLRVTNISEEPRDTYSKIIVKYFLPQRVEQIE